MAKSLVQYQCARLFMKIDGEFYDGMIQYFCIFMKYCIREKRMNMLKKSQAVLIMLCAVMMLFGCGKQIEDFELTE